jgi:hypothetical protein
MTVSAAATVAVASICYEEQTANCSAFWTPPADGCPDSIIYDPMTTKVIPVDGPGFDNFANDPCLIYVRPYIPVPTGDCVPTEPVFISRSGQTLSGNACDGSGGGGT